MKKIPFSLFIFLLATACYGQDGKSELIIPWPKEYNWKTYNTKTGKEFPYFDPSERAFQITFVPENQTMNDWIIKGSIVKYGSNEDKDGIRLIYKFEDGKMVDNLTSIADTIFYLQKQKFFHIKFILLEKYGRGILFKIEPDDPSNGNNESSTLYYLIAGGYGYVYLASVTIHESKLSDEFIAKWSKVFKNSQLIVW